MARTPQGSPPLVAFLWTQRQDIGPSARFGHALAYDAARSRTLLVGGDAVGALLHDTWLWDGETWTQVEDIGPSGRAGHAIAYDAARERVVLFGGRNASALSDTWEWDGTAWTQVEDTGPTARSRHALAYDSGRSRVVLFGGEDAAFALLGDTWEWDGDEWTQVADTGPAPRAGHAMCFDGPGARTLLYGGAVSSDTWSWNGALWTELNDVGPAPCDGTALVSTGQSTILFGGIDAATPTPSLYRRTWELNGTDWTERQDIAPAPRFAHGMAFDSARARVVLHGGGAAAPATLTAADLLADTGSSPRGRRAWTRPTRRGRDARAHSPSSRTSSCRATRSRSRSLDEPAPAATPIAIAIDGTDVGSMMVDAGQATASASVPVAALGLTGGQHSPRRRWGPRDIDRVTDDRVVTTRRSASGSG